MVLVEDGAVHNVAQVFLIALGEEEQRLGVALWRLEQALSIGIFTDAL